MILMIILSCLALSTLASPMYQTVDVKDDGSYRFAFETGKDAGSHSRTEERNANGVVTGKFSYEDPNGEIREVSYRADNLGYIANGDVSVEGAPKGQFPVVLEHQDDRQPVSVVVIEENKPHFENQEEPPQEASESNVSEEAHKEDEIQELPSEDSTADDPPEAFPAGYFLEKFHSLRRLPEPTKEPASSTTTAEEASSSVEEPTSDVVEEQQGPAENPSNSQTPAKESGNVSPNEDLNKIHKDAKSEMDVFMHMRPFHGFPTNQWAPSMLHQPVYVFSYQHPESYGYHYYY